MRSEFEIPPGFESVKGSGAITRESVLSADKELWFFKLPKHVRHLHDDSLPSQSILQT
jgi:hypothetical protein